MKHVKAVLLSLLFLLASTTGAFAQVGTHSVPTCLPGLNCQVKLIKHVTSSALHQHVYWFWYDQVGVLRVSGFSCHRYSCSTQKLQQSFLNVVNNPASLDSIWKANVQGNCPIDGYSSPVDRFQTACEDRARTYYANYKTWLANIPMQEYEWVVKVNGTQTTRPAYTLTNGVRDTVIADRAPVGAKCKPYLPHLAAGSDIWAEYSSTPGLVALCSKKP